MASYTSQYPTQDADHVKATTIYPGYTAQMGTNPALSLTGVWTNNQWVSGDGQAAQQRFHIDLGSEMIVRRIYYENSHNGGVSGGTGAKTFTFWGSNSAASFAELTYATDTGWTQLTIDDSTFDQHVAADQADPKYVLVTNTKEYRYYAVKIADNWGAGEYMGIRRIELQTEDGYVPPSDGSFLLNFI